MSKPDPPTFLIRLRALPNRGGPDPIVRLRRLLKVAGRSFGFRAVEVRPVKGTEPTIRIHDEESVSDTPARQAAG